MANTLINITENGTTTLATAGKYCDRNIDVTVAVENTGGGGGGSKELLGRANPLPACYTYLNNGSNQQTSYFSFIWPAGVDKIYFKSELRVHTNASYTNSYRVFFNFDTVVVGGIEAPYLIIRPTGESDFTTSTSISETDSTLCSVTNFYHAQGSFLTHQGAINLAECGYNVPTEDTPCVLRIMLKNGHTSYYGGAIITLQEEAFE